MSASSMQSAPAHIAAIRVTNFGAGLAAPDLIRDSVMRTFSSSSRDRPACSASVITGTRPAHDTRLSSSNTAESGRKLCDTCTGSAFLMLIRLLCRSSNHPSSEGTFLISTPKTQINSSVYPGLALIWNLRARFVHPPRFPLAIPMTPAAEDDLRYLLGAGADHHFGFGHNLALTSFSVPGAELATLDRSGQFDVVDPWDLLRPIGGYCVTSTEVARFAAGQATIPAFSPTDLQTIGGSYLGSHQGTWMKRKTVVVD